MENVQCLGLLTLEISEFPEELFMLHYPNKDKYLGYYSPVDGTSGLVCFTSAESAKSFVQYADDKAALIKPVTLDEARSIAKHPSRPKVEALLLADNPWKPKALFVRAKHEID